MKLSWWICLFVLVVWFYFVCWLAGRDSSTFLVQPPAQSSITYKIRLGYLRLYPTESWKLTTNPILGFHNFSGWPVPVQYFLMFRKSLLCSSLCPLPIILASCTSVKDLTHPLRTLHSDIYTHWWAPHKHPPVLFKSPSCLSLPS